MVIISSTNHFNFLAFYTYIFKEKNRKGINFVHVVHKTSLCVESLSGSYNLKTIFSSNTQNFKN